VIEELDNLLTEVEVCIALVFAELELLVKTIFKLL